MNRKICLISLIAIIVLSACQDAASGSALSSSALPAGLEIPEKLPAQIQDATLLEAWVYLYNQQQPVHLWNGESYSGRQLAQYVLDQNIPLRWSSPEVCPHGNSCTMRRVCQQESCPDQKPGPIYITPALQERGTDWREQITKTLAHEVFHSLRPLGNVEVTQLEEFLAFYISSQVAQSDWASFKGYDPLNPVCLKIWFRNHRLDYSNRTAYPAALADSVQADAQSCYTVADAATSELTLVAGE